MFENSGLTMFKGLLNHSKLFEEFPNQKSYYFLNKTIFVLLR